MIPIILFIYSRPEYTLQTLEALTQNPEARHSDLYVFADGAKAMATAEQLQKIQEARAVVRSKQWCKTLTVFESEKNKGLANSIIYGVTEILKTHDKAIVLEDDLMLSSHFLSFMNDALNTFANDEKVGGIGASNYFCPPEVVKENFFLRTPDTYGWGIYRRSWQHFNGDSKFLLKEIEMRGWEKRLNMESSINLMRMMREQSIGKVDSWAVRWCASALLNDLLFFYPHTAMARHEGFAGGTNFTGHEQGHDEYVILAEQKNDVTHIPLIENKIALREYIKHHKKTNGLWARGVSTLKRFLRSMKNQATSK